jgi:hypothetical protein
MDRTLRDILLVLAVPTGYALLVRLSVGGNLFSVMSITFLFLVPTVTGYLTVQLSRIERVRLKTYSILAPWLPIVLFMVITLGFDIEGWACWLMVLPLFLVAASIGGLLARHFTLRKVDGHLKISVAILLPFALGPLESLIEVIPGTYEARTSIDIHAPADRIWANVIRVKSIPKEQDSGT